GTLVTRDQRDIPVEISVARLNHRPAGGSNGILVLSDVSARKTAERELRHLARHDTLTGLANRAVFLERLEDALAQAKRTNAMVALLLLDLDNFKGINDSLGHPVGDGLLKGVAERLSRGTRETDTVARLGGDEFAIIATNLPESGGAAEVARKLIQALSIPFWIDGREIRATTSIGISVFPVEESDPDILLKHADFAMYQAKANGPGTWQFYDAEMNARRQARKSMEEDLDRALEDEQFELHYQPKVHAVTGALTGVEALIRWNHSKRGVVSPEAFVPIAETTGRIAAIGDWILGRAIAQHMAWRDVGLGRIPIAINLSPVQFRTGCVANTVRRIAARFDVDPHDIGLEITEGTIIENVDDVIRQLHELREIGYKIFIDDFGTGYSSLAYLKKLPIDALKIDRAFVSRITEDKHDAAIAKAIIDMARSLRLSTVAEGVETPAQLALLRAQGCTEIQGYLFSTPLGADEFAAWFRARGRAPAHGDLHRALDPSS
ncbi:MAG: putative bifunctional diguanylate cyclase/phosphodiesterase, partial [Kiloniellaceae bacterium]